MCITGSNVCFLLYFSFRICSLLYCLTFAVVLPAFSFCALFFFPEVRYFLCLAYSMLMLPLICPVLQSVSEGSRMMLCLLWSDFSFKIFFLNQFLIFLLNQHCMWDLSSPTRDGNRTPCILKPGLLTTGPLGRSLVVFFFKLMDF